MADEQTPHFDMGVGAAIFAVTGQPVWIGVGVALGAATGQITRRDDDGDE